MRTRAGPPVTSPSRGGRGQPQNPEGPRSGQPSVSKLRISARVPGVADPLGAAVAADLCNRLGVVAGVLATSLTTGIAGDDCGIMLLTKPQYRQRPRLVRLTLLVRGDAAVQRVKDATDACGNVQLPAPYEGSVAVQWLGEEHEVPLLVVNWPHDLPASAMQNSLTANGYNVLSCANACSDWPGLPRADALSVVLGPGKRPPTGEPWKLDDGRRVRLDSTIDAGSIPFLPPRPLPPPPSPAHTFPPTGLREAGVCQVAEDPAAVERVRRLVALGAVVDRPAQQPVDGERSPELLDGRALPASDVVRGREAAAEAAPRAVAETTAERPVVAVEEAARAGAADGLAAVAGLQLGPSATGYGTRYQTKQRDKEKQNDVG